MRGGVWLAGCRRGGGRDGRWGGGMGSGPQGRGSDPHDTFLLVALLFKQFVGNNLLL